MQGANGRTLGSGFIFKLYCSSDEYALKALCKPTHDVTHSQ